MMKPDESTELFKSWSEESASFCANSLRSIRNVFSIVNYHFLLHWLAATMKEYYYCNRQYQSANRSQEEEGVKSRPKGLCLKLNSSCLQCHRHKRETKNANTRMHTNELHKQIIISSQTAINLFLFVFNLWLSKVITRSVPHWIFYYF